MLAHQDAGPLEPPLLRTVGDVSDCPKAGAWGGFHGALCVSPSGSPRAVHMPTNRLLL